MTEQPNGKDNIIDLAEKRKRQSTVYRLGQNGRGSKGRDKTAKSKSGRSDVTWMHYVQFFAFLAVLALMLQYCNAGF